MVAARPCTAIKDDGSPCLATPMRDSPFCFWHSPDHQEEASEARRLGGHRRRRERVISGVYDFDGLGNIVQIRRLVEVAVLDALGLDNSIARARTLGSLAQIAAKLLETGEFEERLEALESVLGDRLKKAKAR